MKLLKILESFKSLPLKSIDIQCQMLSVTTKVFLIDSAVLKSEIHESFEHHLHGKE